MSPSTLKIHLKSVLFHKSCRNLCISMPRCIHDTFQWFCLFTNLMSDFVFGKICQKILGIFWKNHLHPCNWKNFSLEEILWNLLKILRKLKGQSIWMSLWIKALVDFAEAFTGKYKFSVTFPIVDQNAFPCFRQLIGSCWRRRSSSTRPLQGS
jgi:hypothetical protein